MQIIEKLVQIKNILKWDCSKSLKIGNKAFLAEQHRMTCELSASNGHT